MAQNNRLLVSGLNGGLLPRILNLTEIPDVYFDWGADHRRSIAAIQHEVDGRMFYFSKESVSTAGQHPPYIRYRLQCNGDTSELTVYITYPEQATVRAVRLATWAAFKEIAGSLDTTYMITRDARGFIYAAQTTTAFQ